MSSRPIERIAAAFTHEQQVQLARAYRDRGPDLEDKSREEFLEYLSVLVARGDQV